VEPKLWQTLLTWVSSYSVLLVCLAYGLDQAQFMLGRLRPVIMPIGRVLFGAHHAAIGIYFFGAYVWLLVTPFFVVSLVVQRAVGLSKPEDESEECDEVT